jgi:hypothetical protein
VDRFSRNRVTTSPWPSLDYFERPEPDNVNPFARQKLTLENREKLIDDASGVLMGNTAVPFVYCTS